MPCSTSVLDDRRGAAATHARDVTAITAAPRLRASRHSSTGYGFDPDVENTTSTSSGPGARSARTSAARPLRRSVCVLCTAPCSGSSSGWYSG